MARTRTTVNLDADLLRAAKKHAIDEGTTLGKLIERGLELVMNGASRVAASPPPLDLPSFGDGSGLLVDVADRDALHGLLDEVADARRG